MSSVKETKAIAMEVTGAIAKEIMMNKNVKSTIKFVKSKP